MAVFFGLFLVGYPIAELGLLESEPEERTECEIYASTQDRLAWRIIFREFSGHSTPSDEAEAPYLERREWLKVVYDNLDETGCLHESELPWRIYFNMPYQDF
jgi:hypothetical protein